MRLVPLLLSLTIALGLPMHAHASKAVGAKRAAPTSDTTSETTSDAVKEANAAPVVIRAEFGLFFPPSSGKKKFVSSRTVPFVPNQAYGWRLTLKRDPGQMRWREEYVLPAAPSTWGGALPGVKQDVSADGRTSAREGELQDGENALTNIWTVAEGDPKGKHVIRLYLDDKLVQTFDFELE